jgi:hypothetical protein
MRCGESSATGGFPSPKGDATRTVGDGRSRREPVRMTAFPLLRETLRVGPSLRRTYRRHLALGFAPLFKVDSPGHSNAVPLPCSL